MMIAEGTTADLNAMDLFLLSVSPDLPVDEQMAQLEARVLLELRRNPIEGPFRIIVSAGYVARVLMSEHDLDQETILARSKAFMEMLTERTTTCKIW